MGLRLPEGMSEVSEQGADPASVPSRDILDYG
jgi:hypothetical protein